eukprot:COSAG02_NODE_4831_length_4927_cov_2.962096_5_plen_53_part_00
MVHTINVLRPWSEHEGASAFSAGDSHATSDGGAHPSILDRLVVDADFVTCTN